MKKFWKDWRNTALLIAVAAIVILVVMGQKDPVVMKVGNQTITESAMLREMKRQSGDQLLISRFETTLIEEYAHQQGIMASDAEISQLEEQIRLQQILSGEELNTSLEKRGMTLQDLRKQLIPQVLQVKLVIPGDELQARVNAEIKKNAAMYTIPKIYRYQEFLFTTAQQAKDAKSLLERARGINSDAREATEELAKACIVPDDARKVKGFAPGLSEVNDTIVSGALMKLQPGEYSAPLEARGDPTWRRVILLRESIPAQEPTLENRGIIIGSNLLKSERDYQVKQQKVFNAALASVSYAFYTADYPNVKKLVDELKQKSQSMPSGAPNGMSRPGATAPITPSAVPTRPGATGGR